MDPGAEPEKPPQQGPELFDPDPPPLFDLFERSAEVNDLVTIRARPPLFARHLEHVAREPGPLVLPRQLANDGPVHPLKLTTVVGVGTAERPFDHPVDEALAAHPSGP